MNKKLTIAIVLMIFIASIILPFVANAAIDDCAPGYVFNRNSGVGCQQKNCYDVPSAHYSYEGYCICGSSGSINENPADPNKACSHGNENESCPGCVYACVHADEECAGTTPITEPATVTTPTVVAPVETPAVQPAAVATTPPDIATSQATSPVIPSLTVATPSETPSTRTCEQECAKLKKGGPNDAVIEFSGTPPNCKCTVDNYDNNNRLIQTIKQDGDSRTIYIFDPATNEMIGRNTISIDAEKQRIRERLGVKYSEEEIDALLEDQKINDWFAEITQKIETNPSGLSPAFWWQHIVALIDHGYGNSADFVDTNNYGRCGDSMEWLERNLSAELELNGEVGRKSEAMLSITGEKWGNVLNHTALIIRPTGFSNIEWNDVVNEFIEKTQAGGMTASDIDNIDPRLLDAKVLDPYFKKTTTIREFIKGWSVIKIS